MIRDKSSNMNWHELDIQSVFRILDSSPSGLSEGEVNNKRDFQGYNIIEISTAKSAWRMVVDQFKDFMIGILVVIAIISGVIGEISDTIIILLIVVLNAVVGFIQDYRTENAMESLRAMTQPHSRVLREGQEKTILSTELVPGDIVLLEEGTVIPADMRLIESHILRIEEAALTGESLPVDKFVEKIPRGDISLGDRFNMVYRGTLVVNGRGKAIVTSTGLNTEIGLIAGLVRQKETITPLKKRLLEFGKKLSYFIIAICFLFFVVGLIQGKEPVNMFLIAVSLAVAAIPEALPSVITLSLTLGAKKLARKHVLIRKLSSVETLGSVTYICTDKTGTLTQNKMTVIQALPFREKEFGVANFSFLEFAMALNHNVYINSTEETSGDPTERAIVDFIMHKYSAEIVKKLIRDYSRTEELPFDSRRKLMTTIHKFDDRWIVVSKGASESIANCLKSNSSKEIVAEDTIRFSQRGMRMIAFAYKFIDAIPQNITYEQVERDLVYAGQVALMDLPRPDAKEAIHKCKRAGIRVVMITGDHLATAAAIAKDMGIYTEGDLLVSGNELSKMSEADLDEKVERIKVYARVSPEQKLNIIKALQRKNHFVAMTGDGVNDAPALKMANIGIAMGLSGTDVSKEASHMILLDDNFATIVKAVGEGRRIYDNIRKFIRYIMTCNSAEICTIIFAPLLGLPLPLLPIQILWLNLITDGLPGLALAAEKAEKNLMTRPPRNANESLFAGGTGFHILWVGLFMTCIALGTQAWAFYSGNSSWQTMVFTVLSFSQFGQAIAARSMGELIIKKGIFSNWSMVIAIGTAIVLHFCLLYTTIGNQFMSVRPLSVKDLMFCIIASLIVFHAVEVEKYIKSFRTA